MMILEQRRLKMVIDNKSVCLNFQMSHNILNSEIDVTGVTVPDPRRPMARADFINSVERRASEGSPLIRGNVHIIVEELQSRPWVSRRSSTGSYNSVIINMDSPSSDFSAEQFPSNRSNNINANRKFNYLEKIIICSDLPIIINSSDFKFSLNDMIYTLLVFCYVLDCL